LEGCAAADKTIAPAASENRMARFILLF